MKYPAPIPYILNFLNKYRVATVVIHENGFCYVDIHTEDGFMYAVMVKENVLGFVDCGIDDSGDFAAPDVTFESLDDLYTFLEKFLTA
jgi:hypothetical protein